jgi:deoxynucleoside triphosphate triphosphohydrolase SAMHD1
MALISPRLKSWADELAANTDWDSALNSSFDAVGFTDAYVDACAQRTAPRHVKAFKDRVWGMVELNPVEVALVDCPLFQRLRNVSQLGFTYLTYPTARHSRFEHSVGVAYVVSRLLASFDTTSRLNPSDQGQTRAVPVGEPLRTFISHAGLLHDLGHAAFSHASERAFERSAGAFTIGPFTVEEFQKLFRKHISLMPGLDSPVPLSGAPKLAELLSIAIVTSARFRRFYRVVTHAEDFEGLHPAFHVAALILGYHIEKNDLGLPEILSGPVDADKIDYMIRDSQACGISIGIDITRVFLRAGMYQIPFKGRLPERLQSLATEGPTTIFVIDQSGSDTVHEMGAARVSLYSRVYHHQLTRNAEWHYCALLEDIVASDVAEKESFTDFLRLWTFPEDAVLYRLTQPPFDKVTNDGARQLLNRSLLSRASSYGEEDFQKSSVIAGFLGLEKVSNPGESETIRSLDRRTAAPITSKQLNAELISECATIRKILLAAKVPKDELPKEDEPKTLRLIPRPNLDEAKLPLASVMTADRTVINSPYRLSSYFEADDVASRRGYLLVSNPWREIANLALQRLVFNDLKESKETVDEELPVMGPGLPFPQGSRSTISRTIRRFHRSILDLVCTGHRCKLKIETLRRTQGMLLSKGYYDAAPQLVAFDDTNAIELVAGRFKTFQGEGKWGVTAASVRLFFEQFPPRLRNDAVELVKNLTYLDGPALSSDVTGAIRIVPGYGKQVFHLVPFTPSSGHLVRTFLSSLKNDLEKTVLHASLVDALAAIDAPFGDHKIIFVDDHTASGTQGESQLKSWFGEPLDKHDRNTFVASLPPDAQRKIRATTIGFAFAAAFDEGLSRLHDSAHRLGLKIDRSSLRAARKLGSIVGTTSTTPALREFLESVGLSVVRSFIKATRPELDGAELEALCVKRSLGYGQMEGLLVTLFGVPSSTYTALWCPGTYAYGDGTEVAWTPLFLRRGTIRHVVLS